MSAIIVEHLSVSYHRGTQETKAIEDISFSIPHGGILGVTGPSGCGKSTLLHVLAGIIHDYKGAIKIDGKEPNPGQHSISLVPQQFALLPWKRVKENILLPVTLGKKSAQTDQLQSVIESLEIDQLLTRYPAELSGGQKQRVALARAFIQSPDLLLMDEPFSALDIRTGKKSRDFFLMMHKALNMTTILVSHNLEEIVDICDQVIVMGGSPGRVLLHSDDVNYKKISEQLKNIME
ncbi:ATP-binding cassette domain-containing protein [Porphyromonadaceae bacterium W3.11]|nr:ATP-binding cassette domain-containing protein [Porphyromonadaceae bacterium W3.11]